MSRTGYDVAVLGGGPVGYAAALRVAKRGGKVCLIEADLVGGTCLNRGCIPTKAMLNSSKLAYDISRASRFGLKVDKPTVDGPALAKRTNQIVKGLRNGVLSLLNARGVDLIAGRGKLTGPDTIEVQTADGRQQIQARSIIIATGSRPAKPEVFDFSHPRIFTTDQATCTDDLPESVIIVGGGIIGCEFATIYSELGIKTTLVEILDSLVALLPAEVSKEITRSLTRRKVEVLTSAKIDSVQADDQQVTCTLDDGRELIANTMLVAAGREPNIEDIGLDAVGVELADGVIAVDSRCRTSVDGIYASGDVAEKLQYAHLATRMGIVAADNAMGIEASDDRAVVPVCMYTHPEVASVGLSETDAAARGDIKTSRFSYQASGIAAAYGETEGEVKLIADAKTNKLLGGLVIGSRATDIIAELALAIRTGLTANDIANTIHPHPSFSEAVGESAEALLGLGAHSLD